MTKIYVGNLPHSTTESHLRSMFSRFGYVSSVQMKTDRATNRSRGFAFVVMPSMDDADEAMVRLSGVSMSGRRLTVNEAVDRGGDPAGTGAMGDIGARKHEARNESLRFFEAIRGS